MAGNYMNAPAPRLAYDKDGSVMVALKAGGLVFALPLAMNISLNSEDQDATYSHTVGSGITHLVILFPVKTNLVSMFLAINNVNQVNQVWVSKDTTNGADGVWTQVYADALDSAYISPMYREAAWQVSLAMGGTTTELKGIKLLISSSTSIANDFKAWFLYGYPTPSIPLDRLAFWEPSADQELNWLTFDWGNTPRSSSEDRTFRIKNLSATLTADNLSLGVESLYPGSPAITGMFTFSWDDVNYYATLTVPDLAPGAISSVIYIRRVIPSNAEVGVKTARVSVEVGAWV